MVDTLGQAIADNDIVVFSVRNGNTSCLKLAVVVDAENMKVVSAEYRFGRWEMASRKGSLLRPDKVVRIEERMVQDEAAQEALVQLRKKSKEYEARTQTDSD